MAIKYTAYCTPFPASFQTERGLGVQYAVLSTNIALRKDGYPRSDRRPPEDTGVAVYFMRQGKQMVFACDKWDRVHDNMRAIGKTIEAIRGIERWGSSDMMNSAFSAFEALPPPGGWRSDLGFTLDASPSEGEIKSKFRDLAKQFHPDHGGDRAQWDRINQAYENALSETCK